MARFCFALEPLLQLRRRLEDRQRTEAMLRLRDLKALEAKQARLRGGILKYGDAFGMPQFCDDALRTTSSALRACAAGAQEAREALHAASNARKAIERLKERRLQEHREARVRAEERELEELR